MKLILSALLSLLSPETARCSTSGDGDAAAVTVSGVPSSLVFIGNSGPAPYEA